MNDRLNKLLAMSQSGTDHERKIARQMLDKLMAKHGVSEDDLTGNVVGKTEPQWFKWKFAWQRKLLFQIVYMVTAPRDVVNGTNKHQGKNAHGFELSRVEYIQIQYLYDVLSKSYKLQLDDFFEAFVRKNEIFPDSSAVKPEKMSPEDYERQKRIRKMGTGITATPKNGIGRNLHLIGGRES